MCLTIITATTPKLKSAEEDIKCYKFFLFDKKEDLLFSPYQSYIIHNVKPGTVIREADDREPRLTRENTWEELTYGCTSYILEEGCFHGVTNLQTLVDAPCGMVNTTLALRPGNYAIQVWEMVIPRDTPYIEGSDGTIAARAMRFEKLLKTFVKTNGRIEKITN